MKQKRTEIAIETARLIVISKPRRLLACCDGCRKQVDWLTLDEAARLAGIGSRDLFRMIEGNVLHSLENGEGILLVCPHSLVLAIPAHSRAKA